VELDPALGGVGLEIGCYVAKLQSHEPLLLASISIIDLP